MTMICGLRPANWERAMRATCLPSAPAPPEIIKIGGVASAGCSIASIVPSNTGGLSPHRAITLPLRGAAAGGDLATQCGGLDLLKRLNQTFQEACWQLPKRQVKLSGR